MATAQEVPRLHIRAAWPDYGTTAQKSSFKATEVAVRTWFHPAESACSETAQAIDRLGEGLRISARDPEDGTIEAVERPDKRFVVGVQWHPENMSATDPHQPACSRRSPTRFRETTFAGGGNKPGAASSHPVVRTSSRSAAGTMEEDRIFHEPRHRSRALPLYICISICSMEGRKEISDN
jgi:Peptidase C26